MEYIGAGLGSLVIGITLALWGLCMLTYRVIPAIKRAVKRCDAETHEVLNINLENPALARLRGIESIQDSCEQRRLVDALYGEGKLPSYVPDGLRQATPIISIILAAQDQRASEREALLARADRHRYAAA